MDRWTEGFFTGAIMTTFFILIGYTICLVIQWAIRKYLS